MANPKITTFLWYAKDAEGAAKHYCSIFPNSRIDRVATMEAASPSGPPGSVKTVELTILGAPFMFMEAGPHHEFNDAVSIMVNCDTQAEIDKYWNAIIEGGGKPVECGWVIDRYGVRWQINAAILNDLMADRDRAKAKRVAEAMLKMKKLDIATLQAAAKG